MTIPSGFSLDWKMLFSYLAEKGLGGSVYERDIELEGKVSVAIAIV